MTIGALPPVNPYGIVGRSVKALRARVTACIALGLMTAAGTAASAAPADAPAWNVPQLRASAARLGGRAASAEQALELMAAAALALDEAGRVRLVNQFFNRHVSFREDVQVWGQIDYWASPMESLAKGEGDCEDYAIAKYFSLRALGVPATRLRLVYVRAVLDWPGGPALAHMVLAYQATTQSEPQILDNLVADVRPASSRPDLTPVFSFNAEGLWQGNGSMPAGDPTARLSRWRETLTKAREEGWTP